EASDDTGDEERAAITLPEQQMREYPDDLRAEYAARFGWSLQDIAQDKGKAYAVKKAIDSDIFAQQLQQQLAALSAHEETDTSEEEESESATEAAQAPPADPQAQQTQYQQFIEQAAALADPKSVAAFGESVAKALLGVDPATIKDPNQRKEAEAFVQRGSEM